MEFYKERIYKALDFIESNLRSDIKVADIANEVAYSKYHFMRVFKLITGNNVGDYVRKRRISESAFDLVETEDSILSIANRYQFEAQESYTRSFQDVFETTPGEYRKIGHKFVGFDKYELSEEQLDAIENYIIMEPKIVEIEERLLVGMSQVSTLAENKVVDMWKSFMPRRFEVKNRLKEEEYYSITPFDHNLDYTKFDENTQFERRAAVEVSSFEDIPEGMQQFKIAGGRYAVFIHRGPVSTFPHTFNYINRTWLPTSEFEHDARDKFEILGKKYFGPNHPNSEEEVWIPIREKEIKAQE